MPYQSPEESAEKVLSVYWNSGKLPIDPYQIADSLGIGVKYVKAKIDIAGSLLKEEKILLYKDSSVTRNKAS